MTTTTRTEIANYITQEEIDADLTHCRCGNKGGGEYGWWMFGGEIICTGCAIKLEIEDAAHPDTISGEPILLTQVLTAWQLAGLNYL